MMSGLNPVTKTDVKNANAAPRELLEKALKIAQEKGDLAAELKIVEALRERGDS